MNGYHNEDNLNDLHLGNDSMTGIIVDAGVTVTLFESHNFTGHQTTITGPAKYCSNIPNFDNDSLSSLIVKTQPKVTSQGQWNAAVRSNEEITGGMQSSVSTTNSHSVTNTEGIAITASITEGFIFAKGLVSSTVSLGTSTTVGSVISHGKTESCSASCDNPKHESVALFQWETLSENVGEQGNQATVKTCFYRCRYGIDTQSPPKCPAGACKDGPCNTCYPWKKDSETQVDSPEVGSKFLAEE